MPRTANLNPNMAAFLDMLAWSEIGPDLLKVSDDGYNVLVGSTPTAPLLFKSYATHPDVYNRKLNSDAAGRYQFMARYWLFYKQELSLPDFGPESQDKWAIHYIHECYATALVNAGDIRRAIFRCGSRWASLPDAGYGQHENAMQPLLDAYTNAGGFLA